MPKITPFPCYMIKQEWAEEVVTPAYDAFTPAERAAFVKEHPGNYMNVIRSLDEFAGEEPMTLEALLDQNAANLQNLLRKGVFAKCQQPCLYLYQMRAGDHEQIGLVCEIAIDEYAAGQSLKVHEQTRREKEDQLLAYLDTVGASSSPVCCTYVHRQDIDEAVAQYISNHAPLVDFQTRDQVRHSVWRIDHKETVQHLVTMFADLPVSYLTDGHHRAAVALRYAQERRQALGEELTGKEPFHFLLVVFFPDHQLQILPYNRCVKGLNGLSREAFLDKLASHFEVIRLEQKAQVRCLPDQPRHFTCLLGDQWYALRLKPDVPIPKDPVRQLDVSLLHDFILEPVLGIKEARSDPRMSYISGASGKQGMVRSCRQGFDVAFACYGTSVAELIAVAEAGQVMPPKSTWFEPKARSGLFVRFRNKTEESEE